MFHLVFIAIVNRISYLISVSDNWLLLHIATPLIYGSGLFVVFSFVFLSSWATNPGLCTDQVSALQLNYTPALTLMIFRC
jgi:hypothetical protein